MASSSYSKQKPTPSLTAEAMRSYGAIQAPMSSTIPGTDYYGKTKHGGYACKQIAISAGYHEAKE